MRRWMLSTVMILILGGLLMILPSGCEILWFLGFDIDDDTAKVQSFDDDLQASKKLSPVDEEGNLDVEGLTNIGKRAYTGSTGDKDADAALSTGDVMKNFAEAEKLMEQGRKNRDTDAMQEALRMRPNDWAYHLSAAALLLETKAPANAVLLFGEADELLSKQEGQTLQYANQGIRELEDVRQRIGHDYGSYFQCEVLHQRLALFYKIRHSFSKDDNDLKQVQRYDEDAGRCQQ